MRMRGLWVVGVVGFLGGCPGEIPPADPDARPDGPGAGNLTIRFSSDLDLPAMTAPDRRLEEVDLNAERVRAIADVAEGTRFDVRIRWQESDGPDDVQIDADPGLYGRVELRLLGDGGDDDSFEIRGEALVEGVWRAFELSGDDLMTIAIQTTTSLPAGGSATIEVPVDLARMIAQVDFTMCLVTVEMDLDCDAQLGVVAASVAAAFPDEVAPTE